jgi:hypothetical protein
MVGRRGPLRRRSPLLAQRPTCATREDRVGLIDNAMLAPPQPSLDGEELARIEEKLTEAGLL